MTIDLNEVIMARREENMKKFMILLDFATNLFMKNMEAGKDHRALAKECFNAAEDFFSVVQEEQEARLS